MIILNGVFLKSILPEYLKFVLYEFIHQLSADRERQALESFVKESGTDIAVEAWDWRYYAEKVCNCLDEYHYSILTQ